ncbi:MAG TPA: heme o synthase [Miltoncostaeaceae bacterium]|nr:heme o synthase [Miltoncostaeaceae bacterium]
MTTEAVRERDAVAPVPVPGGLRGLVGDYVRLTKPRVISLLLVTTAAAMFVAAGGVPGGWLLLWTLVGGYLAAGGANAINHFIDRDIDGHMARTAERPVVAGRVTPARALAFGIALGALSALVLTLAANALAAALALVGLAVYVGVYSLWLKRTTIHNIVIGGAAGAVPPLVGWAAVTGELSLYAWILFAVVFYWTPPHFWALALLLERDYAAAGVPMLPVVHGEETTRRQILLWTLVMVGVSLLPAAAGLAGAVYAASALVLGGVFALLALRLLREGTRRMARLTFHWSLLYLALLFVAMAVDAA